MLKKGSRVNRGYATLVENDGVNYRDIADTMTVLGFSMNHSSARNHVLRVMRKFVKALALDLAGLELSDTRTNEVAKSPAFQHGMADVLTAIELERREIAKQGKVI